MADVTFTVDNEGLPIHKDATVTIRPRLFLEGNFFLDLRPGSPSAPDLSSGGDIPVSQTATAVQLDQILTSLQKDNRTDLKQTLAGYGNALTHKPTPAEDKTQAPSVHGLTAAQALNQTFKYGGKAGRTSSIVNQALLGEQPHDLSNLIRGQRNLFSELASDQGALRGLITNFNTTAGALASESHEPVGDDPGAGADAGAGPPDASPPRPGAAAVPVPGDRARARASASSRRRSAPARRGSSRSKRLLKKNELGNDAQLPGAGRAPGWRRRPSRRLSLFPQTDLLSRCTSHNLIPAGNTVLEDSGRATDFTHRPAQLPRVLLLARSSSRARARSSTATAPSSASRPAAARH